jgi:hypothetical protein
LNNHFPDSADFFVRPDHKISIFSPGEPQEKREDQATGQGEKGDAETQPIQGIDHQEGSDIWDMEN